MGVIVKFPIVVTNQKATEWQFGLAPELCASVSLTGSTSAVVSEHGIATAFNELSATISGDNVGVGMSIFDSITAVDPNDMLLLQFNSLSGVGDIYTTSNDTTVFVNTYQAGTPGSSGDFVVTRKTLNGGIHQLGYNIRHDLINNKELMTVTKDFVIGKILIRCTEGFDGTSPGRFCIGTERDISGFVLPFDLPTEATTDRLVQFEYGPLMTDKVQFVESKGSPAISATAGNILDGQSIIATKVGRLDGTRGNLQVVIFYDDYEIESP